MPAVSTEDAFSAAYVTPSSPTPSLASSSSDIDELLSPSPPDASPLYVELLRNAKMGEYQSPALQCLGLSGMNVVQRIMRFRGQSV